VAQTALDALNAGFQVFIAADAVNSRKDSDLNTALAQLRHAGCTVASAEAILFMLLKTAKHPAFKAVSKLVR
jgi:nicotinamidase-related amidase